MLLKIIKALIAAFFIDIVVSMVFLILGYYINILIDLYRKHKLKNMLSLKPNNSTAIIAELNGKFYYEGSGKLSNCSRFHSISTVYNVNQISNMLAYIGTKYILKDIKTHNEKIDDRTNIFVIGGFMANLYTAKILDETFSNVKFGYPNDTLEKLPHTKSIIDTNSENCYSIYIEGTNLKFSYDFYTEGYLVLIKLSGKHNYSCKDKGTTHIIFGENGPITQAGVSIFTNYSEELYSRIKDKSYYFLVIGTDINGNIDFNKFYDWTEYAFE